MRVGLLFCYRGGSGVNAALANCVGYAIDGQHVRRDAVVHVVRFGVADDVFERRAHDVIKLLVHDGTIAGFLFGFPDLSAALQRSHGRITPWAIVDLLLEYRRTRWLIVNGAGILPQYQRLGGNALLYHMLERIAARKRFLYVDAVQIAETTELMLADMKTLGGKIYKVHRIYQRDL